MRTSTGFSLPADLQMELVEVRKACLSVDTEAVAPIWTSSMVKLYGLRLAPAHEEAWVDAIQDLGFDLGLFDFNANAMRNYERDKVCPYG